MNVKLHTPKTLQTGSGMSSVKQFLLSLIATSVSIILTFGTAAIIDHNKKQAAKKEMVMMIVSDIDDSIDLVEKVDTGLIECRRLQNDIALHLEHFDSLRVDFASRMAWIFEEFPETTERIFTSSIETFNTIGDVNFVKEVSSFYMNRHKYKEMIIDELKDQWVENDVLQSFESLLDINYPEYVLLNHSWLQEMKQLRNRCMQMMKVSEEDLADFNKQHTVTVNPENDTRSSKSADEFVSYSTVLEQAKEKLKK